MASRQATPMQTPIRGQGQDKCPDHQSTITFFCKDCKGKLVCLECVTSIHQGHNLEKLSDVALNKKQKIQDFVVKSEKNRLPQIRKQIESINKQIKDNSVNIKTTTDKIKSQGDQFEIESKRITDVLVSTYKTLQRNNHDLMCQYREDLQTVEREIMDRVAVGKEAMISGSNVEVIDVERMVNKNLHQPQLPALLKVDFDEQQNPMTHLQKGMGSLTVNGERNITKPQSAVARQFKVNDSKVESEFQVSNFLFSIAKQSPDKLWVFLKNEEMQLVSLSGKMEDRFTMNQAIHKCISPVTGNIWFSMKHFIGIFEMLDGDKYTEHFIPTHVPISLCFAPDNNLVVGSIHCVSVYNIAGELLHTTEGQLLHSAARQVLNTTTGQVMHVTHASCRNLVTIPRSIAVCSNTGDIAVCDYDPLIWGGDDKPRVTVFSPELQLKYQYFGSQKSEHSFVKHDFNPSDVVFDSLGYLLIADYDNQCIQLVSDEGQFLTVVHTDTLYPKSLVLLQDGKLCVGFSDKTVKIIHYNA